MAQPGLDQQHAFDLAGVSLLPFAMLDEQQVVAVWQMRTHPEIARWMNTGGDISLETHRAFMARQHQDTRNLNYLCLDAQGILGVIALHRLDWQNRLAWLGIYRNPSRPDKGLGARLLATVNHLAFEVARLHTLKLEVVADNERAIQAYLRAGFRHEGVWREAVYRPHTTNYVDLVLMGITEQEWRHP